MILLDSIIPWGRSVFDDALQGLGAANFAKRVSEVDRSCSRFIAET
jgi:hypothetical protein